MVLCLHGNRRVRDDAESDQLFRWHFGLYRVVMDKAFLLEYSLADRASARCLSAQQIVPDWDEKSWRCCGDDQHGFNRVAYPNLRTGALHSIAKYRRYRTTNMAWPQSGVTFAVFQLAVA